MENDKKIEQLEKKVSILTNQLAELVQRIRFLERENNRRKGETSQIANHVNRK